MTHPLSLDNILQTLSNDSPAVKTASAPSSLEADMLASVQALTKTAGAAPTAPTGNAVDALHKIAAETAAAEGVMLQKTAELAGAAMCDGFMSRLAGYDNAISQKTAGVQGGYSEEHLKLAYAQGIEDMEKQAAAEFEQGQADAFNEFHKIAAEVHLAGQQSARNVLLALGARA
jgi:hypothetical protein